MPGCIAGIVMLMAPSLTLVLLVQIIDLCWLCAGAGQLLSIIVTIVGAFVSRAATTRPSPS